MAARARYRAGVMRAVIGCVLIVLATLSGCGDKPRATAKRPVITVSTPPAASGPAPSDAGAAGSGASIGPQASGAAAGTRGPAPSAALTAYVAGRPGHLGLVVRDRTTKETWRVGETTFAAWTASTIKVAIAATLYERQRAGTIKLTATDRTNLRAMLVDSSNEAADALWNAYDGVGMIDGFRTKYGMSNLAVVSGYRPYWRHLQCTAEDLTALMGYVLDRLPAADRGDLVSLLRAAGTAHPWGVWAAGPAQLPGHKPGWAFKPEGKPDHWVTHSVGFAGPGERYIVAVTYDLPVGRGVDDGIQAVSDVVALAFGRPVPAQVKGP
jgi:hypothetical protein